ncbi:MAG: tetratricopeptide repeat protein, partial [Desulfobulbaceae bacterium]|nr:tetratricopeptide repeat protein [Desulfobulbaceae bacterium]
DLAGAAAGYRCLLEVAPDHVGAAYNLGALCYDQNKFAEAAASYAQAAGITPDDPDVWFNLGLALKAQGDLKEAVICYGSAIELAPDDADSHYNLGVVLNELHLFEEAAESFSEALAIQPDYVSALNNLGIVYHHLGRTEEAVDCFRRVAEMGHNPEAAEHITAALTGKTTAAPPPEYVESLFDEFSERFDQRLIEELEYRAPEALRLLLDTLPGVPKSFANVIDLGCGTGLSGITFLDIADRLTGVDLSTGMIEVAQKKELYDRLESGDITSFLEESDEDYDLFVASDVLIYLGDLTRFFAAVKGKARPGGYLVFSTESCEGSSFILRPTGRYAYSRAYIETMAAAHGFTVLTCRKEELRKERGEWIMGDLFALRLA